MARSHPAPDCDWRSENFQASNDGRARLMTSATASWSLVLSAASPSCGQLIVTGMSCRLRRPPCGPCRLILNLTPTLALLQAMGLRVNPLDRDPSSLVRDPVQLVGRHGWSMVRKPQRMIFDY